MKSSMLVLMVCGENLLKEGCLGFALGKTQGISYKQSSVSGDRGVATEK